MKRSGTGSQNEKEKKMKKLLCALLATALVASMAACGGSTPPAPAESDAPAASEVSSAAPEADGEENADAGTPAEGGFTAAMVTDVGGINDQSFNQSAWEGMERLKSEKGVNTSFLESKKDADYAPNLDKVTDDAPDIVWGIGFLMKDALAAAAENNPDQLYALVDDVFEDGQYENAIGVQFQAEQSSFLVGYIAASKTEANHVGFLLGMESPVMDRFKYGYQAGVMYGAKELGKDITYDFALAESFNDTAKGKAMAQKMYTDGADVIFHAAGQTGAGAIEAAKEMDKMIIGVDLDQNWLAPENVITSALKNVGTAVYNVTERIMNGEELGGTNVTMGLSEGGVGIAPSSDKHLSAELLAKVDELQQKIIAGDIAVPYTQADYDAFVAGL